MKIAVARESLLLGKEKPSYAACDKISYNELVEDRVSASIMGQYMGEITNRKPVETTGDGDCLFNAVSILLNGNESLSVELRFLTVLEMVNEEKKVQNQDDRASIKILSPNYEQAVLDCAKISAYSSMWTAVALSYVVDRPLKTHYPAVNGSKDLAFRAFNATFNAKAAGELLDVMWTSTSNVSNRKKIWTPNHFVAMVPIIVDEHTSNKKTEIVR